MNTPIEYSLGVAPSTLQVATAVAWRSRFHGVSCVKKFQYPDAASTNH